MTGNNYFSYKNKINVNYKNGYCNYFNICFIVTLSLKLVR